MSKKDFILDVITLIIFIISIILILISIFARKGISIELHVAMILTLLGNIMNLIRYIIRKKKMK